MSNVIEALYVINKHAKKYAEQGTKRYHNGKKTTAKKNSYRKEALYDLKREVLKQIKDDADKIELHLIDNSEFYCFYFDNFSFHVPTQNIEVNKNFTEKTSLDGFEKTPDKTLSDMTLKESLLTVQKEYNLNANDFLPQKYLSYGYDNYFIGWSYLG